MSLVAMGAKRPLLPKSALTTPAMSNAGGPEPCQPNGTMATGTARSWPSVIVMLSCASATPAHHAHAAAAMPSNCILPRRRAELASHFTTLSITTPTLDASENAERPSLFGAEVDVQVT